MANGPKVFLVDKDYKADYKVFLVEHSYKEKNAQLLAGGTLVQKDYQADTKVFLVDKDYKADICIMQRNFPRAGR